MLLCLAQMVETAHWKALVPQLLATATAQEECPQTKYAVVVLLQQLIGVLEASFVE